MQNNRINLDGSLNLSIQTGGTGHYTKQAVQPFELIDEYKLDYYQGNVVKYLLRYKYKHGLQDLDKAIDYLNIVIQRLQIKRRSVMFKVCAYIKSKFKRNKTLYNKAVKENMLYPPEDIILAACTFNNTDLAKLEEARYLLVKTSQEYISVYGEEK